MLGSGLYVGDRYRKLNFIGHGCCVIVAKQKQMIVKSQCCRRLFGDVLPHNE
jgi:hypothetical protein